MPILRLTPFNHQELFKLQHPSLAATVPLAPLMEDRHPRMKSALLVLTTSTFLVLNIALLASTLRAVGDLQGWIIVLGLGRWCRDGLWGCRGGCGHRCAARVRGIQGGDLCVEGFVVDSGLLFFEGGWFVGCGVDARCAGGNFHEFVKGEDAGVAALPSW